MKAVVFAVCILFCGSLFAGEKPAYLTPPETDEQASQISKVSFVGAVVFVAAAFVLGEVAISKTKSTSSSATLNTANNLFTASLICDGIAAASLTTALITF